jgi:hypothetical protein
MEKRLNRAGSVAFYLAAVGAAVLAAAAVAGLAAEPVAIEPRLVHLRSDAAREWSSFPEKADGAHLELKFAATKNEGEQTLRLRQQDVKQGWRMLLNGKPLGQLVRDEADMVVYLPIAAGLLTGENTLRIECTARGAQTSDDIRVGEIQLDPRPVAEVLSEATLEIDVRDADTNQPLPARITVVNSAGALQTTSAASTDKLAVRPGVIYSADGNARAGVPAGKYTIYASRGFEYSLAQVETTLAAGESAKHTLQIRREVPTPGYVACDTHIHTLTFSGHGDATIAERMITLAGEGIELPIATDHNVHIDYEEHAQRSAVRKHFTPVIGNEVTTPAGHFNVFPIDREARVPNHRHKEWSATFEEIFATPGVRIAILNHARDLHSGVRPFGPERFNEATGDQLDGWPMRFNAMEVINSGATQTDALELARDWMTLLNHGYEITPVGSSDSHDVSRYIVGQGRTYIRCDDRDVSQLDVQTAVASFLQGRVLVSYGLIAELTLSGKYQSGELAAIAGDEVEVAIRVLGPHWVEANRIQLYANGQLLREEQIAADAPRDLPAGVKWQATWRLPRLAHDVHLVAIALGKGIDAPYWPTAKPYQPTSPDWQARTFGVSGAVWLDGDKDGQSSSARDYAERIAAEAAGSLDKLIAGLANYDAAVAAQAAHVFRTSGGKLSAEELAAAIKVAPPQVAAGLRFYQEAWRASELARAAP